MHPGGYYQTHLKTEIFFFQAEGIINILLQITTYFF